MGLGREGGVSKEALGAGLAQSCPFWEKVSVLGKGSVPRSRVP